MTNLNTEDIFAQILFENRFAQIQKLIEIMEEHDLKTRFNQASPAAIKRILEKYRNIHRC